MAHVAAMLVQTHRDQASAILSEALRTCCAFDAYVLLQRVLQESDLLFIKRLLEDAADAFAPSMHDFFLAALEERDRKCFLMSRRDVVREPELRYFLAILMNAQSRRHAVELAEAYASDTPGADTIVSWLCALADVKVKLQLGGVPWEPSALGLPVPDEPSRTALRRMLSGQPIDAAPGTPFFEAVRRQRAFAPLFVS
jgi:uncharacterized protein (DUF1778 family)